MSAYTTLASALLFPVHELLKRHDTTRIRRALEVSQWLEPEALRAAQLQRLRTFLQDIAQGVPYYRELFARERFEPAGLQSVADLAALPALTKPIIRTRYDDLKHREARALGRSSTGGSTGEPLIFGLGRERVSHDVAAKWRATRWWGVDIGDPEIVVWGSPIELGAQDRMRQWRDRVFRSELVPAFAMSEPALDAALVRIRARRPRMVFGYPSALAHIARHAQARGVDLADLGVKVAFCTGERLYPEQRVAISRVFGCPVANGYGGRDAGFVAHECPHGGLHLTHEDIVVEVVDAELKPVPAGLPGEIVVTHLASRDFPFVRYRTGDVAVLDDRRCACGRGLPLLKEIQGRSNDFIVALDGTVMQGAALTYVLRETPGIEAFKIVQQTRELTTLQLVVGRGFDHQRAGEIVRQFKRRLGETVDVRLEFVDRIAPEKSGKYRYIISHVDAASARAGVPA